MKIFQINKIEDFGIDYEILIFKGKTRTFLQFNIGWSITPSPPYLQISLGLNSLFDILFFAHSFGFNFTLFGYNWERI